MANYAHPETLVDARWLAEHFEDPDLAIIEMDLDSEAYDVGHIPGCIFWSAFAPLLPDMRINFDYSAMAKLLSDLGINNRTTVIAVYRGFTATSGLIFWLLKMFGHQDVRILNGGFPKWQQEGLPVTDKVKAITPGNYAIAQLDSSLQATASEVRQGISDQNTVLLDVRTPQEYRGEIYLQAPPKANERAGHIPSAINLYYELAHNEDGTFKTASQLEQLYGNLGVTQDKQIIPYCAVGGRSAHTWFILKYLLGYSQVKNYDGSWNEWSQLPDTDVVR